MPSRSDPKILYEKSARSKTSQYGGIFCLEWTGSLKTNTGYGQITRNKKGYLTHRAAWSDVNGEIPEGRQICHLCHNRKCIEITHLYLGDQASNMRDRNLAGRQRKKLTEEQVREIRSDPRATAEIAVQYGISTRSVNSIKSRQYFD